MERLWQDANDAFAAERERWVLWLPPLVGIGIAFYFALPVEPPLWLTALLPPAALLLVFLGRRRTWSLLVAISLAALGLGFAVSAWRTAAVSAPFLEKRLGPVALQGRVAEVELREVGVRLIIDRPMIAALPAEATPERVRVVVRAKGEPVRPGGWVRLRAVLLPPPPPAAPGAFDFARQAFFRGIGAVGFAVSRAENIAPPAGEGSGGLSAWLSRLRQDIANRVSAGLEAPAGAVATALMTGQRGAIPEHVLGALRDSGLAHLLAISGLHVGLVAGLAFFAVRALLALFERIALRYPVKKWAAMAALIAAFAYLLLTGATIPTQRAFLMATLVLVAVMLDRAALSMRLVAWAATAVLCTAPESLLGPSFQMSFAAVVALIAAYEVCREPLAAWRGERSRPRRLLIYFLGIGLTTLVAGLATTPFAVFHFNRVVSYGLLANLVAIPLMGLWIMPWAMLAFLLMPFGLEALALMPMGWGIDSVIGVAQWVADLPGAVTLVPAMPVWGLAAVALGGLWLCLWRGRWRLLGAPAIALGLATLAMVRSPDILVDGEGRLFAARAESGALSLSSGRVARTTGEIWLRRVGQAEAAPWPRGGQAIAGRLTCDGLGCIYRDRGHAVSLVRDPRALEEDCDRSNVVVSLVPVRGPCASAHLVIDRFDLWRGGAHALYLDEGAVRAESVAESRGFRPWVNRRGR
jgi:competence protein ComEC